MLSYAIRSEGHQTVVELCEREKPVPGPRQLLVEIHAAGLNRGEFILGHGLHGASGQAKPVGIEAAGVVLQAGAEVTRFKPGDRIMGRCPGAFSQFTVMDEMEAMAVPDGLSFQEAACVPLTYLTAYDSVILGGQLQPQEWLLVNGITSGVGVASLQLAKWLGAKVIGTSGSADKLAKLQGKLDLPLCTRLPDYQEAVMKATDGKGVDLVINTVGGSVFSHSMSCLGFQGRFAVVGYVDGVLEAKVDLEHLHAKRIKVFGVSNKLRTMAQRAAAIPGFSEKILPAFGSGQLKPLLDRVFAFNELPQAKAYMEANQHVGKIVLAVK